MNPFQLGQLENRNTYGSSQHKNSSDLKYILPPGKSITPLIAPSKLGDRGDAGTHREMNVPLRHSLPAAIDPETRAI